MRLSALQFAAATDVAANLDDIERMVARAAADGAEVSVLPEAVMHDFGPVDLPLGPVAQPLDGPFVAGLAELAARHSMWIVAGMFEVSPDPDRPFNTVVVVDASGETVASYRKAHLYDSFGYRESDRLSSGEPEAVTFSIGDLSVGLMTCYDLRFPEFGRLLVDAGSDLVLVPAAWVRGPLKEAHWSTLLRARAIENTVYVVGAGQSGDRYTGCSAIVDPMGVALAALGDDLEGVATAAVDAERLASVRQRNPSLANRRLRLTSADGSEDAAARAHQ